MEAADFRCPACGAEIHPNAKACRACGADERSGWRNDADEIDAASAAGISDDDDFDYEAFVADEFGERKPAAKETFKIIVALVLVAALLVGAGLGGCFAR